MEAAMNLLSSSSPFPSRTNVRSSPSLSLSASMLHEQTSAIPSMPTNSLWRQYRASVLSQEQHDGCRPSLLNVREDRTSQLQSTLSRKKIEDGASVPELMGTSGLHLGDLKDQFFYWSGLSYLLPSLENEEHPALADVDNHMLTDVAASDVISLAREALSASKLALSLVESSDVFDADRLNDTSTVKLRRVMSTKLLERKAKKRRSSKTKIIHNTESPENPQSRRSSKRVDLTDPLRLFLGDPGTKQLLSIDEENELIRHIQDHIKSLEVKRKLQAQFEREPTFAEWADAVGLSSMALRSEVHSWRRSREKLIYANFRMVVHIAKQYQGRGLSLPDLLQEGSMGLMKSVEKFKPQAGCRFPSYAYWWIRQSIRKAIFQHSRTIRVPENMYGLLGKVIEARKAYIQEGNQYPTTEELAKHVGITVEKLQNLLFLMRNPLSIQQPVWTDQDTTFQEVTADTRIESPDICVERQLMRKHIRNLLGILTPREQQIIKLRYGIGSRSGKQSTLTEIGTFYGLSKERVRQIERQALRKLKQSLDNHGLEAYTDLLL